MNLETCFAPLLDGLLKSAALVLAGSALLAVFRKASAADRHALSVAIFAALLLLPLTQLIAPRWSLALESPPAAAPVSPLVLIEAIPSTALAGTSEVGAPQAESMPLVIPWKALFVALWLGGAVLLLARRAHISLRLRALARGSVLIQDEALARSICEFMEANGARARVRESAACRVPLVAGIARPIVLLPEEARGWSEARVAFALSHELGHIRRRDCLTRLLADVVCALYWLNPLVWLAARQMRLAQEQACDDLVLNSGAPADEYAEQLVESVRNLQAGDFGSRHALAMAQPSTLEIRVLAIIDPARNRSSRGGRSALGGIFFAVVMLAICTAAQLRGAQATPRLAVDNARPNAIDMQGPQVEIGAKFIEIAGGPVDLPHFLKEAGPAIVPPEQAATVHLLHEKGGVKILATPRVITHAGQPAMIHIGREFRYSTEWEKEPKTGAWKSKTTGTKTLGLTFEVTAKLGAEGTIDLELQPSMRDLADMVDLDAAQAGAKPDPTKVVPEGHRAQPVFTERKLSTRVTLQPGETRAIHGSKTSDGRLVVLVTARVVGPGVAALEPREKEADVPPRAEDKKGGGGAGSPQDRAEAEWMYPRIEFREASVREVAEYLVATSRKLDPAGKGVNIVVKKGGALDEAKITLSLTNVPIEDVLRYVASLADAEIVKEKFAFFLQPIAAPVVPKEEAAVKAGAAAPAKIEGGSWKKAESIILPRLEFRDSSLAESLDFLRVKAKQLDPAKEGVNLVLQPAAQDKDRKITLSLVNIPLSEALRYVAQLADFEVVADERSIMIRPVGTKPSK